MLISQDAHGGSYIFQHHWKYIYTVSVLLLSLIGNRLKTLFKPSPSPSAFWWENSRWLWSDKMPWRSSVFCWAEAPLGSLLPWNAGGWAEAPCCLLKSWNDCFILLGFCIVLPSSLLPCTAGTAWVQTQGRLPKYLSGLFALFCCSIDPVIQFSLFALPGVLVL